MKNITLPTGSCTLGNAVEVLRRIVMLLPFWKAGSDLKVVMAALDIEDALDKVGGDLQLKLSDDSFGLMVQAMSLQQNGSPAASIQDPVVNRFYLRIFAAVMKAESGD